MASFDNVLICALIIFIGIDLGLKFSKIYKTYLDFDPKYKSIEKFKRTNMLNLNFSMVLGFILIMVNTLLHFDNLTKGLDNPIDLALTAITLILMFTEIVLKFSFSYYTHVFVYEDGLLIENILVPWDKCIVTKEEPSFITNGSVQISYETVEKKKVVTKLIKVPRDTDVSFMKNLEITHHKCF